LWKYTLMKSARTESIDRTAVALTLLALILIGLLILV